MQHQLHSIVPPAAGPAVVDLPREMKKEAQRETPWRRSTASYQSSYLAHHLPAMDFPYGMTAERIQVLSRAEGVYVWDSDGKRYLDGMAGLGCVALGYGRQELAEAAARQMRELCYAPLFSTTAHPAVVALSEALFELLPPQFSHVIYTNSGSEANDSLIRVVRRYWQARGKPGKTVLIARHNGYHGSSVGSASLGGMSAMHEMGNLPVADIHHIGEPHWFGYQGELSEEEFGLQAARELEDKILALGPDKVAAFVAEPFQWAGGCIFPPASYWPEIQRICRRHDVLLCMDEVVGGFGRTGEWFSHQHFGLEPDTLTIAKGLTSAYVPMGGLVLSRRIADVLYAHEGPFPHGFTTSGHPVAAAVALANLELLQREGWVARIKRDTGPYLQSRLRQALGEHPLVIDLQGKGLVAAVQLGLSRAERKRFDGVATEQAVGMFCAEAAREEGLIVRAVSARLVIAPPLIANRKQIDELVDKLARAVERTAQRLGMRRAEAA